MMSVLRNTDLNVHYKVPYLTAKHDKGKLSRVQSGLVGTLHSAFCAQPGAQDNGSFVLGGVLL